MNTPIRMTKATATQVSGSVNIELSLQRRIDGAVHRAAVGQHAGEPLHDRGGRFRGDAADVAHRGLARRGDVLFRLGELDGMPRAVLSGACAVQAMVFSASASLTASRCSSVLRSASEAAFSFSRVSAPS